VTAATPPSDHDLVHLALRGDERAMRLLWARHAPRVDAVVRRLVADPDRAADVAQEVWIQIFRALPGWRGDAQFGTWLHRVAVNRTLNAIRSDRRRERVETSLDAAAAGADDRAGEAALARALEAATAVEPEGDRALLAAAIEAAAARLAPGARQVFLLHDVEGWTHEEIAAQLGITAGGSKSQLFKARARLRQLLAPLVDDRPAHAARSAGDRPPPRGGGGRHGTAGSLGPASPAPGVPGAPAPPPAAWMAPPRAHATPAPTVRRSVALPVAPPEGTTVVPHVAPRPARASRS
jgi:RNA polymerase sigma-70 factor (ECF subfamily)